jgi:hypothetical protein
MKVTATEYQLQLIDKVVGEGTYGKTRSEVLNSVALEHAMYLAAGGEPDDTKYLSAGGRRDDTGGQVILEVVKPNYGPKRDGFLLQPITGKAVPVYKRRGPQSCPGRRRAAAAGKGGTMVDYIPCYRTITGIGCAMGFAYWGKN